MEVVIPDRWRQGFGQFTKDMQPRYDWLREQVLSAESWLDDHANWLKRLAKTGGPNRPDRPWRFGIHLSFVLDASDPEHDEDSDNIMCEMFDTLPLIPGDAGRCYPLTNWRDDFFHRSDHPPCLLNQGWLMRVLVDRGNPSLGWDNILRIGQVWIEAFLVFDKTFPLDPSASTMPISPTGIFACNSFEGDNWKKILFAKRYPHPEPHDDALTCGQIARLDQMNTLMAGIETYFGTCGRWFQAACTKDGSSISGKEDDGWSMDARMEFVLDQHDPLFQVGGENTLCVKDHPVASCMVGKYRDLSRTTRTVWNWNEYEHRAGHPLAHQRHCWLFHDLYDHFCPKLGWQNILRIGSVKTSVRIRFAQSFPLLGRE